MFLKTESFEHNGVTVTLSELSALQRIEHLALMKRQAEQAESDSNRKFTVEDAIRTGAFLVAMSLWHNHPQKTKQPLNKLSRKCLPPGPQRQFLMLKTWCTGCPVCMSLW